MGLTLFGGLYHKRRVLVTGHTGFKGSWLALWLTELGAEVTGIALDPQSHPNHWELLRLSIVDHRADIRDGETVRRLIQEVQPEIVFHLAAQPLVRRSYVEPVETWETNVIGTAQVLDACRITESVRAVVVITSDKCYDNREWPWGYRENDALGGHDPYSASKAAAELVAASYRKAFFGDAGSPLIATARAGNVIGGGDWSEDRLVPDLVRAIAAKVSLEIRYPRATRPWQHVLEPLAGYLQLGDKLLSGEREFATAWNFGPEAEGNRCVAEVLIGLRNEWPELAWTSTSTKEPHEALLLSLDSTLARTKLGWRTVWNFAATLKATAEWYRTFQNTGQVPSREQLADYASLAREAGLAWAAV